VAQGEVVESIPPLEVAVAMLQLELQVHPIRSEALVEMDQQALSMQVLLLVQVEEVAVAIRTLPLQVVLVVEALVAFRALEDLQAQPILEEVLAVVEAVAVNLVALADQESSS
jgi:hypothetical protein